MKSMQSLIDAHDDPFVLIDADYRIVAANRAYAQAYGVADDAVVGHKCHAVSHHSDVPCHERGECCPHREVLHGGLPFDAVHVHFDPRGRAERVRLRGHPIVAPDGRRLLGESIRRLAPEAQECAHAEPMAGHSPRFLAMLQQLEAAAATEAPVLLGGESGTGKELAAQYLHRRSRRAGGAFHTLDCTSIPEALFESELFGHERGAYTGCVGMRRGLFEQADHGTLFLDEIGELPLSQQAKLLRVLERGEFRRVGGHATLRADVRVIAASNRDLAAMVEAGAFRPDLYYRLGVLEIVLPPLRQRREDIPTLARALLQRAAPPCELRCDALDKLALHDFPGNVRELRNVLLRAAALAGSGPIGAEHIVLPAAAPPEAPPAAANWRTLPEHEQRRRIAATLHSCNGHREATAKALGIGERTLYRKLRSLGLQAGAAGG